MRVLLNPYYIPVFFVFLKRKKRSVDKIEEQRQVLPVATGSLTIWVHLKHHVRLKVPGLRTLRAIRIFCVYAIELNSFLL